MLKPRPLISTATYKRITNTLEAASPRYLAERAPVSQEDLYDITAYEFFTGETGITPEQMHTAHREGFRTDQLPTPELRAYFSMADTEEQRRDRRAAESLPAFMLFAARQGRELLELDMEDWT